MITLKQLEYFLVIAEAGSISKASELLHVSQPPLSMQLKMLEEELGVPLFLREKKRLVITKQGIVFKESVSELFDSINKIIQDVRALGDRLPMTLHIGTISSVSIRLLPKMIFDFRNKYPNVDIQVSEMSTYSIMHLLDNQKIDIGIIRMPFDINKYNRLPIRDSILGVNNEDLFVALAAPKFFPEAESDEIELEKLADLPIILHERYISIFTVYCKKLGFFPNIICKNNDIMSLLSWATADLGVAVIPYTSSVLNNDPHLIRKKIINPEIQSRAFVVWNKEVMLLPEAEAFIYAIGDDNKTI